MTTTKVKIRKDAKHKRPEPRRAAEERYWDAVLAHDRSFDDTFVYSVATTGVYCRPSCAARRPNRRNVVFYSSCADAEAAGFRACKRCRPDRPSLHNQYTTVVTEACRLIETAEELPSLATLAKAAGLSVFHFHRIFKAISGVTPRAYASAHRQKRVRDHLNNGSGTVTEAIHKSGFNSSGRFYASSSEVLGMTPTAFRSGGADAEMRFAVGECSLGSILVAASHKGITAIMLGDDPEILIHDLEDRFPKANLIGGDRDFEDVMAKVVGLVEDPQAGIDLPLDVRGTAFQHRVWKALLDIPLGTTATYSGIAVRIGAPKAVRAVAGACAANKIAIAIPCHRVVRNDGSLSGYRWGVERKRALIAREAQRSNARPSK
ncbi:MAG TPA: bifunctional DNA-binding transcriptional regulator/O6-methylguanine-DNA methyltransferase Ada [Hyphomicrobium sp.]|jgi:AraC family transcriptional regulator of adaptative response/methylated-DNA-[protein]-cysteine methyltransferase|nr:bifunctional DNA-binding transcriptional regulator/O6-methylguanine-DNA methyltransferase Ada [Hyphomicrobium sp.]